MATCTCRAKAPLLGDGIDIPNRNVVETTTTRTLESACGRLIRRAFTPHELPSLIEAVSSSKDERETIRRLPGDDAQTFVDVIDEALDTLELLPRTRKKCLKSLYRTCGGHARLPKRLEVSVWYDKTGVALYRGGFADVWKGKHCGRDVAVKVIRTYTTSDLNKIIGRFCKEAVMWNALSHPNILQLRGVTMSEGRFAMVSDWMVGGNIWEFVKARPDANRLELLGGVARGLIYIHGQGMIHGDLKGANVLIDQTGHPRLADFGLLTIISDPANLLSSGSYTQGGTARWMSPELMDPERFGFENNRPTKASDCYALGMVIYETISGNLPFHKHADLAVVAKVLEGERPPRGASFAESLWKLLQLCWVSQPNDRPNIENVLQFLEMAANLSEPPSLGVGEGMEEDDEGMREDGDSLDSATGSSGVPYGASSTTTAERNTATSSIVGAVDDGGADSQEGVRSLQDRILHPTIPPRSHRLLAYLSVLDWTLRFWKRLSGFRSLLRIVRASEATRTRPPPTGLFHGANYFSRPSCDPEYKFRLKNTSGHEQDPAASNTQPEAENRDQAGSQAGVPVVGRRQVHYPDGPAPPEVEVNSYGYRPAVTDTAKMQKKHDRMLVIFWGPVLLLAFFWVFIHSIWTSISFVKDMLSLRGMLRL